MIGSTISHYRVLEKLGEGGMGAVYKAEDTKLQRTVALKFLPPDLTGDPEARERFVREAQAASALDHPNICTVHEIGTSADGQMFIVMACCEGESLKTRLERGPLRLSDAVSIAAQVARGLARAHAKGVVHRDVKPGNIIVSEDGTVKIVDFGLAKPDGRTVLTRAGVALGTPAYMSPEQARGDSVDQRTDIWSLGVVLYEMLARERPFKSEYEQALVYSILNEEPRPVSGVRTDVPWVLEQIVMRAMAKSLDERYQTVEEMLTDLTALAQELELEASAQAFGTGQTAPSEGVGQRPSSQPRSTEQTPLPQGLRQASADKPRPVFVARESELERLGRALDAALLGRGRVVFLTGEAGGGKTALLAEFARRAQEAHPGLIVAGGSCNAHTGIGDPYLPFREMLGLLTGDVETACAAGSISAEHATKLWNLVPVSVQALVDSYSDLIDTFVSGARLVSRATVFSSGRAAWLPRLKKLVERKASVPADPTIQQSNLFEQYTRMLHTLARGNPLFVFVEDLQWADAGSVGLLFHMGRRLDGHRILVMGSYRPAEVAQGQDGVGRQLISVVNELKRIFGEVEVPVGEVEDRGFVDAYLDSQPNRLGAAFGDTLFRHTRGHPLFTIELLRGMQDQAMLVRDDKGRWVEGPRLNWEALPARIDAVIEERVGRLSEYLRHILDLASVEGDEFTAEVLAAALQRETGEVVHLLSGELDKRHQLVSARGVRRVGAQRLSLYKFQHILFQKYLYNSLDEIERSHLHEQVGARLESLYGQQAEEIALRLARHFQEAGMAEKAVEYLLLAGKRAVRVSANQEAIAHFNRALELLQTMPETPGRVEMEITLQMALVPPWEGAKGFGAPELGIALARARELCQQLGSTHKLAEVLAGLAGHYATLPQYRTALELVEQVAAMARVANDPMLTAVVHYSNIWPLLNVAELEKARECAECMLQIYDPNKHSHWAYLFGYDYGVMAFGFGSWVQWLLGYPDRALSWNQQSISLSRKLRHPFTLAFALVGGCEVHWFLRDSEAISRYTDELIPLAAEKGFVYWEGHGVFYRGESWTLEGRVEEGIAEMRRGLAMMRGTGTGTCLTRLLTRVADACRKVGEIEQGLSAVSEAMELMRRFDERYMEAELHRLKGELLLMSHGSEAGTLAAAGAAAEAEAEKCFLEALEVSRKQSARSWELRAAMSMTRLRTAQGRRDEARALLSGVYDSFTEGLDTPDLKDAKALLGRL